MNLKKFTWHVFRNYSSNILMSLYRVTSFIKTIKYKAIPYFLHQGASAAEILNLYIPVFLTFDRKYILFFITYL